MGTKVAEIRSCKLDYKIESQFDSVGQYCWFFWCVCLGFIKINKFVLYWYGNKYL